MEVIPEAGDAIRLGSLQTEVGGATRAMSGIWCDRLENRGSRGGKDLTLGPCGSRMVIAGAAKMNFEFSGSGNLHDTRHWCQDLYHILFNITIDLAAFTDLTASTVSNVKTFDQGGSPFENE